MACALAGCDCLIESDLGLRLLAYITDNDPITNAPKHTKQCTCVFIAHMEKLAMNALSGSVAEKVA
jgi:hypothetical protein